MNSLKHALFLFFSKILKVYFLLFFVSCQIVSPSSPTSPENPGTYQDDGKNSKHSPTASPAATNWLLRLLESTESQKSKPTDTTYQITVLDWLRHVQIYDSWELQFDGYAVLMSPMMVDAYKSYVLDKQGPTAKFDQNIVGSENISLIVAFYSQSSVFRELNNQRIWTLGLGYQNQWYSPKLVSRYRAGDQANSYFPTSDWTQTYLVTFVLPEDVNHQLKQRLGQPPYVHIPPQGEAPKNPLSFRMSSALSTAQFMWDVP